jgi:hypothetical protein
MGDGDDDAYVMTRIDYLSDPISARRAGELFEQARAREGSELTGDLESGFEFYARVTGEGAQLVRCRVARSRPR